MKNNLDTPVAKQCRALYTKYAYGHTYGLLKVGLRDKNCLETQKGAAF